MWIYYYENCLKWISRFCGKCRIVLLHIASVFCLYCVILNFEWHASRHERRHAMASVTRIAEGATSWPTLPLINCISLRLVRPKSALKHEKKKIWTRRFIFILVLAQYLTSIVVVRLKFNFKYITLPC